MRAGLLAILLAGLSNAAPISLAVDATEAPRKIFHVKMVVPASPGPLTLVYPKWIPGEHGPTGPITDVAGLKFSAAGKALAWQRDPADMHAFRLEVPPGATAVEVAMDYLSPAAVAGFSSGASATAQLAVISWNQVLLYPQGRPAEELTFAASLRLPSGWKYGTALPVAKESEGTIEFQPVSLVTLVDSPLIAGQHFRAIPLAAGITPSHQIDVVADSAAALAMTPETLAHYNKLVAETGALFGARHYRQYRFLLTLSDYVAHFGLEHHESSDNRVPERSLIEEDARKVMATLLPHEMTHSWNGKYRRPADLITADFQQPQRTALLWVYEGLTQYLGSILTARSGLWTPETYRENLALLAAALDHQAGRSWRPLEDTAVAAQLLYESRPDWRAWRRSTDFYDEGLLIWLEVDATIRRLSEGRRSLDDFCRLFHGGQSGRPELKPYTFDDVMAALNQVAAYDWRTFFRTRVQEPAPHAPLGGVEGGGWRLIYNETIPALLKAREKTDQVADLSFSIGITIKDDEGKPEHGTIIDVIPGLPAAQAGIGPGMRLVAVNGRRWSTDVLREAVRATKTASEPLHLLVENREFFRTYHLKYRDGERYPHLERDPAGPDLLGQILKPLAAR